MLASCGNDEPFKHLVVADSPSMFSTFTPVGGMRQSLGLADDVTYHLTIDDERRNATLVIDNFKASPDDEGEIVTFTDLTWTYEPGSHEKRRVIKAAELHSTPGPGADVVITDVNIVYTESNELSEEPTVGFYATYVVNNIYKVESYPYAVYADGTTVVAVGTDPDDRHVDYEPIYLIRFNPSQSSASIEVRGLPIGNESCTFSIDNLALKLVEGGYELASQSSSEVTSLSGCSQLISVVVLTGIASMQDELNLEIELKVGEASVKVEAFLDPDLCGIRD